MNAFRKERPRRQRPVVLLAVVPLLLLGTFGWAAEARAAEPTAALNQVFPGRMGRVHGPSPAEIRRLKGRAHGISLAPSQTEPNWACPESTCDALIDPAARTVRAGRRTRYLSPAGALLEGGGEKGGIDPQELESAYSIPTSTGAGDTVAIVDANGYAAAEEDLAVYRKKYGLPACTKANGCFEKLNQHGEEDDYPPEHGGWEVEQALDLDMVSSACPACKIVLVEANGAYRETLEEAVQAAAAAGAGEISNSYGGPEEGCEGGCAGEPSAYDIPGVMVFASSGDSGYDNHEEGEQAPSSPASLPFVISVGGTNLRRASNSRGWEDTAWSQGGSGCSHYEPKPAWQHDSACAHRMSVDVAADASCETPLSVYDLNGWDLICGTSASSPLLAGIEAHASPYAHSLPGADAFYNDPQALYDVTAGSNGTCTPPAQDSYWCNAQPGYDGPTGNGVPDGPLGAESSPPDVATGTPAEVTATGAELVGEVQEQGTPVTYRFECGTSTAYGLTVPSPEGTIEAGDSEVTVRAAVSGLEAGRRYHFRLVATGASGISDGVDVTFDTAAPSITSVSPSESPPDGGASVTITGSDFDSATAVHFGTHEAAFVTNSSESITALAPYGSGSQPVSVTTPFGVSPAGPEAVFTYGKPGSVLGWGSNSESALGREVQLPQAEVPVEVAGVREAVQLATGPGQSFALNGDGTVTSWGNSNYSLGNAARSGEPVKVCAIGTSLRSCDEGGGPYLHEVTAVAAGLWFGLALLRDGRVVSWGYDRQGQLGRPQPTKPLAAEEADYTPGYVCLTDKGTPAACKPHKYLEGVTAIAAGENWALAVLQNGTVVGWGADDYGQLGPKVKKLASCPAFGTSGEVPCSVVPVTVEGVSEVGAIAAGDHHALALLHNGTVRSWGSGELGQLGAGGTPAVGTPTAVCALGEAAPCAHELSGVKAIATGDDFSTALLGDGHVMDWGYNFRGRLGTGSAEGPETCEAEPCSRVPVEVTGLEGVTSIAAGIFDSSSLADTSSGQLFTWGGNAYGQLGDALTEPDATPTHVCAAFAPGPCPEGPYLEGPVTSMALGVYHDLVSMKIAPAVVTDVSPKGGPGAGGTSVTISGTGFAEATGVSFGGTPARSFEVRSDSEIVAVAPRGSGTVEVTVTIPGGSSEARFGDRYAYETPSVASLRPDSGPQAGGTAVTIRGSNLEGATAVDFGAVPASEYEVRSSDVVVAVAPPGEGSVEVTVTTPNGTSAPTEADTFTYMGLPTVVTEPPVGVETDSAVVTGSVDPNLVKLTSCFFEWGTTSEYGHDTLGCGAGHGEGEGSEPEHVSGDLKGLTPGTTYHYRLVASNELGAAYGEDRTFTTRVSEPPELGRCVQLEQPEGEFSDEGCIDRSNAQDGAYGWEVEPGALAHFGGSASKPKLETEAGAMLRCNALTVTGTYTGISSLQAELALTGCALKKAKGMLAGATLGPCQSEGAAAGTIATGPLTAGLGIVFTKVAKLGGWALGHVSITVSCGSFRFRLSGGQIAVAAPVDLPVTGSTWRFEGKKSPEGLSGQRTKDRLFVESLEPSTSEQAYLYAEASIAGEEPLEIKVSE